MSIYDIQKAVEKFAPKENAEEWDNTGVLIDCGNVCEQKAKILVTIDMTKPVLDEAIEKNINYVISYHPIIFPKISSITNELYIKCIKNNISVYSPHTQMDKLMNEYVLNLIVGKDFESILEILKKLSKMQIMRVVRNKENKGKIFIKENILVGVGSAFRGVDIKNSLIITGEMGHHDMLRCKKNNTDVILMEHSNSERIVLPYILSLLKDELPEEKYEIFISQKDKDPVEFL